MKKKRVGFYGVSGCAGCLLSVLFEENFKEITKLVNVKAFPLVKEDKYKGEFDYIFVEGTVCFDEDILKLNELRKRTKFIVAFGSCACFGGVPSIKNFLDNEKVMRLVYPVYNHLKSELPTPIDMHIKVDYYVPQCPPNKEEVLEFIKFIVTEREFKPSRELVCFECRKKSNACLLEKGKMCLGPVTNGGCGAICPSNNTECYGCRGPSKDANFRAFYEKLKDMGYTKKSMYEKMKTFAGLKFKEEEGNSSAWLEND